ncbi:glycosyltransferase family 2 protein [Planococcus plakortidis]
MSGLTIFTPTYNRGYTLERLYKSLLRQTNKNFEWVIVDDGSTDNTRELVSEWINDGFISIRYLYQVNRGKHIAHNLGVEHANESLFTCLDSDDWFYDDTVEFVLNLYSSLADKNSLAGIIGIDTYSDKKIVGNTFPSDVKFSNWKDLNFKHQLKGDKAIFFVTSVIKKVPFPNNEDKHMPPSYQLYNINSNYKFALTNKELKFVEYLPDGITFNIRKKYKIAPHNYSEYRKLMMRISPKITFKLKNAIHFNISKRYSEKRIVINEMSILDRAMIIITSPMGLILWLWIEFKK